MKTRGYINQLPLLTGCFIMVGFWSASNAFGADDWRELFDGRSLRGWKASENPATFTVIEGQICANGSRAHLFYAGDSEGADFENFEFQADVLAKPGANSGVYFHTAYQERGWPDQGFEVQINNTQPRHGNYVERKKTGSLYGIRNIYKTLFRDNEWFTLRIRVQTPRVQVWVNDLLLVDYQEPINAASVPNLRRLSRGTFALQGHDPESQVHFKNIRVRRLPAAAAAPSEVKVLFDDIDRALLRLQDANYPVVDFHGHLKGGLTLAETLVLSRQTGINYGIAINCGVGFSVTNDAGIDAFLQTLAGQPVFAGMQAEGREWLRLFSPAAIAKFDYVFTDAMTFSNLRGKRMRLWMRDEVEVGDKQAFMELLVSRIEAILNTEPIDIYVNPTFLPDVIAAEYEALWTRQRMERVIRALVKNGVALEINARYRLPSATFIKMAKQAGVKFTFGTNNGGRDLGRLEYGLEIVQACGLTWDDMWMPEAKH